MDIEFSRSAAKFLQSADRPTCERIRAGILGLMQQPPIGDIRYCRGGSRPRTVCASESIGLSTVIYKEKTVRLISTSEILVHVAGFTNKEGDNHDHTGTGNFDDV